MTKMKPIALLLVLALSLASAGCGMKFFGGDDEEEAFEGIRLTRVNLERNEGTAKHPSTLNQTYAANVVKSLYYKATPNGETAKIFDDSDNEAIVRELTTLFQSIGAEEKITFKYFGKTKRETKGYTYIDENNNWNWVFQRVNADVLDTSGEIVLGKYFQQKVIPTLLQGDIKKPNWVLTNPSMIPDQIEGIAGDVPKTVSPDQKKKNNLDDELRGLDDTEQRLRFLKKLKDGGYITKKDYDELKRKVLNEM